MGRSVVWLTPSGPGSFLCQAPAITHRSASPCFLLPGSSTSDSLRTPDSAFPFLRSAGALQPSPVGVGRDSEMLLGPLLPEAQHYGAALIKQTRPACLCFAFPQK